MFLFFVDVTLFFFGFFISGDICLLIGYTLFFNSFCSFDKNVMVYFISSVSCNIFGDVELFPGRLGNKIWTIRLGSAHSYSPNK